MNIGLRYELTPYWSEHNDHIALFDPAIGKIVVPNTALTTVSPLVPTSFVQVVGASSVGLPQGLLYTDTDNFAPRIGLAYRPWGTQTVFRAGFGIFYNVTPFPYYNIGSTVPFVINQPAYTNPTSAPTVVLPQVFPSAGSGGLSSISLPSALNSHLPIPYSEQYNLTIEREQWNTGFRISYIGTDSRQDTFSYNINAPVPNAQTFVSKPRPFSNYPAIGYNTNGAYHEFNGLTLQATRQLKGGLFYQAAYTWARDMGNYDWGGSGYNTVEDPFNFQRDKGPDQYQPNNRFSGVLMYWLPFGHGRHWLSGTSKALNEVVGGWQVTGIWTVQSAQHLTPQWSGADPVGITYTTGSPAQVTIRPNVNGSPNSGGQGNIHQWFNTSVFGATLGQFGNAGPGNHQRPRG